MVVATNNNSKLEELKKILSNYDLYSLKEKNINIDVIEDGNDFFANALKKAKEIYNVVHEDVIADDSGLCINCLDGFPGVNTNRFLGKDATDAEKNEYLINKVNNYEDRSAKVVCILVYYDGENIITGEGIIEGYISNKRKGTNGFGFDEIFTLPNGKTLAELTPDEKNEVSARSLAAADLSEKLKAMKN